MSRKSENTAGPSCPITILPDRAIRGLKLISFLDNFWCIRSRIIYRDQALFVRRALFEELGGFPNQLILGDMAFCRWVIKVTEPLLLSPPIVTDTLKFIKMGAWRSFVPVLLNILHVQFRLPILP
ncbi:MAG: hypothetical protein KF682_10790 [Nitrospira sp.]|nr:hypothetical protein [Nitrospira sp.]